jgi:hypothetical protein
MTTPWIDNHVYLCFSILGIITAISAVIWNRWYTRRLFIRVFRQELRKELRILYLTGAQQTPIEEEEDL